MSVELEPTDDSECRNCGARVSDLFRRVAGDSDDVAHRCRSCDSDRRISRGSAAGLELSIPDPETTPGHQRNDSTALVADGGAPFSDRGQLTVGGWIALTSVLGALGAVIWAMVIFA